MKSLITVIISIGILIGGYFGYNKYEEHKFLTAITPPVKLSSLRMANAMRFETEKGSNITYKELFEKLETDISEIDKNILTIQSISTSKTKKQTEIILAYIKGGQDLNDRMKR